ncbi:MAG: diguanylate cyclase [bacterium]|nr:diguanylate cyclase [bacterium]
MAASKQPSYHLIFTLCFLLFGAVVAAVTSVVNFNLQYTDIQRDIAGRAQKESRYKRELVINYMESADQKALAVSSSLFLSEFLKRPTPKNWQNLNELLKAQSLADRKIMQLRLLDMQGQELARVDRKELGAMPQIRSKEELQDKSGRYYFAASKGLLAGQYWHSRIDLNMEHGQIEEPHKPTIRVSTLVTVDNQAAGIVVLNLHIGFLLRQLVSSADFNVLMIDRDAEYIYHHDQNRAFSRYLKGPNLLEDLPLLARDLRAGTDAPQGAYFLVGLEPYILNQEQPTLVLLPRNELLSRLKTNNLVHAGWIALTVILASLPLSYLISIIPLRLQHKLQRTLTQLQEFTQTIDRHVLTLHLNTEGVILEGSRAFAAAVGYSQKNLAGRRFVDLLQPENLDLASQWESLVQGTFWQGELHCARLDHRSLWLDAVLAAKTNSKGELEGFTLLAENVTDKKRIEELSITDPLTGAFNRNKLTQAFEREIARAERYSQPLSVILLDLDHFKLVNDTHGHLVGDQVLVATVQLLQRELRKTDILGRWGGEEFLVLCPETENPGAVLLAEKLRLALEAAVHPSAGRVTVSIGVTSYRAGDQAESLVARADEALYRSKDQGRNQVSTQ